MVSLAALQLGWTLEARGCTLRVTDDGYLVVRPSRLLTDDDRAQIVALKPELIALVTYCESPPDAELGRT